MTGIILAGGRGTRPNPRTVEASKQMPQTNKRQTRKQSNISTPCDLRCFQVPFGVSSDLSVFDAKQTHPAGPAEGLIFGCDFTGKDDIAMILGGDITFGRCLAGICRPAAARRACLPGGTKYATHLRQRAEYAA